MTSRVGVRRFLAALAVAAALLPTSQAIANVDPLDLEDEVVCVVCERPLSVSAGAAADDERDVITGLADQGLSKDQIKEQLVKEYGKGVLIDDKSSIAAFAPWAAAIVGALAIGLFIWRRGNRRADGEPAPAVAGAGPDPSPAPPASAADEARIEAELAARD